ncbi:DUF3375 domain-containing protein [Tunicatimonas pelagia]|uniref:DUF3375 domain-containing protein n=1 Tax=Tunicatimonas pelagia TaxID=931531 RepID=UPI0026670A0A|nr:DUF3375 domain-containing protein [Tunicatimonas pelagia]WKN41774.1 DUF3375 domain-containing protein [Tunicatimonas pelagia]
MHYEDLRYHLDHHVALRFVRKDHAPLIGSFLHHAFKAENHFKVLETELTNRLYDFLSTLNAGHDPALYPLSPKEYLKQWTQNGFLSRAYEENWDVPIYQLTSGSEMALRWLADLDKKSFVGTESRLLQIIRLLEEMVQKTQIDPAERIKLLEKQKEALDQEIAELSVREEPLEPDETQLKERFFELERMARDLMADFREVGENFRSLDRRAREKQLTKTTTRGKMVGEVLDAYDALWQSDQGKSFAAFWELLMNTQQQEALDGMIRQVKQLPQVASLSSNAVISRLKINLINVGDQVNQSNHQLVAQLRRFLDAQVLLENRRIAETIDTIQTEAVALKDTINWRKPFFWLDDKPTTDFTMARPLFTPPTRPVIATEVIEEGVSDHQTDVLFEQVYVDPQELQRRIRKLLRQHGQVSLQEVTRHFPIEKGLTELLTYLNLASQDSRTVVDTEVVEEIEVRDKKYSEEPFLVDVPQHIFSR